LGICIHKTSLPHRPDDYIGFTSSCPPHILQQNCAHQPEQRVRAELLNTRTAGIDTYTLTTITLLLVIRTQRYMWSLDKVGCMAKSSQQSFCHWWQNIHYHL